MSQSLSETRGRISPPVESKARFAARKMRDAIIIQVLVTSSLTLGLYSTAADWFSTKNHNAELSGYLDAVQSSSDERLSEARRHAEAYNAVMPQGPLRDPFSDRNGSAPDVAGYAAYEALLQVAPSETIGRVRYPEIGLSLPVYHGTSEEVLRKGAGHLYGSSLPIGGPGTHTVLTAHSGLVHASLFTPVLKAAIGDEFSVEVLGEAQWYRVDSIETVLPNETGALRIVPGSDYVTLITCTPLAVNTHRLLVRGERIEAPADSFDPAVGGDGIEEGFPWWLIGVAGGSMLSLWYLYATRSAASSRESA
ncbi:MAG: class C sortase [Leucobacter sp.]